MRCTLHVCNPDGRIFCTSQVFNPGKDSKYDVTSENWELGFALLYQPFYKFEDEKKHLKK